MSHLYFPTELTKSLKILPLISLVVVFVLASFIFYQPTAISSEPVPTVTRLIFSTPTALASQSEARRTTRALRNDARTEKEEERTVCRIRLGGSWPNQMLEPLSDVPCVDGQAGDFACQNVDLLSFLPSLALNPSGVISDSLNGNDLWGWSHPETGAEYALVGLRKGTAFVDVTTPITPTVVGFLPTAAEQLSREVARDLKVYENHAFIVSETRPHGMQVVDLMQLPNIVQVAHYEGFGSAHNIAINEATGYAYVVGSDSCEGGLHIIDVHEPTAPRYEGCFEEVGYIHDTQCVLYPAPHKEPPILRPSAHALGGKSLAPTGAGKEVCFAASPSRDALTIIDVSDKKAITTLASVPYEGAVYPHQVSLTEDYQYLLMGDEFDEVNNGIDTTIYVWDVSDLEKPALVDAFVGETPAIDHNVYVRGGRAFLSNYRAGLRLLDLSQMSAISEVGYFDLYPEDDHPSYGGAWSAYIYLPSGNILLNGIEQGLFVLRPTSAAVAPDFDIEPTQRRVDLCPDEPATLQLNSHALYDYTGSYRLSLIGVPEGVSASFGTTTLQAGERTTLSLEMTDRRSGTYYLTLSASDGNATRQESLTMQLQAQCEWNLWLPIVGR